MAHSAFCQSNVQASPSTNQIITQPSGTSLTIQGTTDVDSDGDAPALSIYGWNGAYGAVLQATNPGTTCDGCNFIGAAFMSNGNAGGHSSYNTALYTSAQNGTNNYAAVFANGNVGVGTINPPGLFTIASPAPDGAGAANQGILFVDSLAGGTAWSWTHGAIYSVGSGGYNGDLVFATDGDGQANNNATEKMRVRYNGNVGIGTSTPNALLEVSGNTQIDGNLNVAGTVNASQGLNLNTGQQGINVNLSGGTDPSTYNSLSFSSAYGPVSWGATSNPLNGWGTTIWSWQPNNANNGANLAFATGNGATISPNSNIRMMIDSSGNVGMGLNNPGVDLRSIANAPSPSTHVLEVAGDIAFTQAGNPAGSGGGIIFSDGTIQTTAYVMPNCPVAELHMPGQALSSMGGDYAESIDVTGAKKDYEPGDVMVIDPSHPGRFLKSSTPYSTLVAGIYSTKPGFVGRRQTTDQKAASSEIPMGMVGIVPTKASTESGPIHIGDLLVTSSIPGHVMKGIKSEFMTGAIVGKALAALESGTGVIEVLVSLQ